ncbi:hypothetical protein KEM09_12755 [Carboxylicivirga mesophila]|uniref:Uncharacterized protein n=1 Tax=Carboxylicivirga mesophila TaxID=1166478 RepID=A0ABS5KB76_9BACT|nr:hypothetical protein [Carboxylicivirga mesophila]MBS2212278.1 hypothetical protein [Carboxylicivirga mesophila]
MGNGFIDKHDILTINGELVGIVVLPDSKVEMADLGDGIYIISCRIKGRFYS